MPTKSVEIAENEMLVEYRDDFEIEIISLRFLNQAADIPHLAIPSWLEDVLQTYIAEGEAEGEVGAK